MQHQFSYEATLAASQKIMWRIEDIIGGENQLDFSKPFMPESLAGVEQLTFLSADERRVLNQIRGNAYLRIFGIVEEFILPFLLDHTRVQFDAGDDRTRALLQFAGEEAKHIQLFRRFQEAFDAGFGSPCGVIGPASAIGEAVLAHDPLSVALVILQIEWMTQSHYVDSIKDDGDLDPLFKSMLRHHWMEEAQHAKLDTLTVEEIAAGYDAERIEAAFQGYLSIGAFIDGGLVQQVEFDMESFETATGRTLTESERERFREVQLAANRWTYLGSGARHRNFLSTLGAISPSARERVEATF